ncbi:MAG: 2-isopropylmalate synthase, partial [Proteobacteria bacterium SW_6_67_9]
NGLGERAGNAALEEVVMAVHTRRDFFPCDTGIETTELLPTSRLVANVTGFYVQPNKAIVGANAFAHESGIHQDGVLKARETYEIMKAQDVGWTNNRMVLGKHSGRNAFRSKLEELGIMFDTESELDDVFARFKDLADKKHEIFDEDIQALVTESITEEVNEYYQLDRLQVCCETQVTPEAEVHMTVNGEAREAKASGDGPVDAAFSAIEAIVDSGAELRLYAVNSITGGTDAQGEVTVRLMQDQRIVNGQAADTDIVIASAKSYVNALNKLHQSEFREHPQIAAADL